MFALVLSLAALGAQDPAAAAPSEPAPALERGIFLPEGPAALAWALRGADAGAQRSATWTQRQARGAWNELDLECWSRWISGLDAAHGSVDPTARSAAGFEWVAPGLAEIAAAQGRSEDAWAHFARAWPSLRAPLALRLAVGVTDDALLRQADGERWCVALPDGVELHPVMPPGCFPKPGEIHRRALRIVGLRVGAAELSMEVRAELDGVQIDLAHLSGGACKLAIALPQPIEIGTAMEYVDWMRQETPIGQPLALAIAPGDEPHTLWARFEARRLPWGQQLPEELPAQIAHSGLVLSSTPEDPERALLESFARALELVLAVPVQCDFSGAPRGLAPDARPARAQPRALAPVEIELAPGPLRRNKIAALTGMAERFALRRADAKARAPR